MVNNLYGEGLFWVNASSSGVIVFAKIIPKGAKNAIESVAKDASGQMYMKIRVTAVPENGKANKAIIKLLAKAWSLPVSSFSIVAGAKDRIKKIAIVGDTDILMETILRWDGRLR